MSISPGLAAFKLSFELSPIVLVGGIAGLITGNYLPIIAITQAFDFLGLVNGNSNIDLDNFFARFEPMNGASLIDQKIGTYPFANQNVAANAVIFEPLTISMKMTVAVRGEGAYASKLATMIGLQTTLAAHNSLGGTYIVATPTFFYTNCVMLRLVCISNPSSTQPQNTWQWDFQQPLLTLDQAGQAQNSMMSQITAGVPSTGALSGLVPNVGNSANLASVGLVAGLKSLAGASTSAPVFGPIP